MNKSYMRGQGDGYIVCSWDERVQCYRESGELPYEQARAAVGTDNCRNPKDCDKPSHQH